MAARFQRNGQGFRWKEMPARAAGCKKNRPAHAALTGRSISARGLRRVTAIKKPMPMPSEIIDDPP
jgi:hypothetical protein